LLSRLPPLFGWRLTPTNGRGACDDETRVDSSHSRRCPRHCADGEHGPEWERQFSGHRCLAPSQGATDKQRADAWEPFIGNAGTYSIKGNELTRNIIVSKNPSAMNNGNFTVHVFRMEGKNTLFLTEKANRRGPVADPDTIKLTRLE
jgi:hypothetical protein